MLKVAIIGAGRIGKVHAESIVRQVPNADVVAIVDPYLNEDIEKWANSLCIYRCIKDYQEVLNDRSIDAVLICSSTDTHSKISIDAIKANKHVFCEKPIDHDVEKIKEVIKELSKSNVKYQVGFNRRFDHNFMRAKESIKEGKVGDINIVKITSRDPSPPPIDYIKVSGGLFLDMAIHDFDMVRYITDSEVDEIFAYGANLIDEKIGKAGDIDTAIVSMKLNNGALAVIDNSRQASYGYDQRLEVFGSLGQVAIGNDTMANYTLSTKDGVMSDKPLHFFLERYMDAYALEIRMFIDAITFGKDVAVSIHDGLMDVIVGLSARESYQKKAPVKIKDILRKYNL